MEKSLNTLEFNIIVEKVQNKAILEASVRQLEASPLMSDLDDIAYVLNEIDEALILIQRMSRFPILFSSDISKILNLTNKGGIIALDDLLEMMKFLDTIKANILYLKRLEEYDIKAPYFSTQVNELYYPLELNQRIKEIITTDGEIKDDASPSLKQIRRSIRDTEKQIRNKLQEIINKQSSKLTSNLVSMRNDRYVIPVRSDQKNTIAGIVHDQSASGETVFIEPQVVNQLNNNLNQLREEEKREIFRILREISEDIAYVSEVLSIDYKIIVHLDIVFAKAEYAFEINAKKPQINNQGLLELYNCRHPLLKVDKVVSNNIAIGKDYQGIIITGPNTGGKTVLLKTIGLIAVMVRFGLLVPCDEESQVMIFDKILVDIGDEQSIDQNLSTFSGHLKNVIDIIDQVTEHSLVLLDELGSGTDPVEGSALAIAIFDYLLEKECLVIATSHYSELKLHAYQSDKIINASVEFDINTLKPTYKLMLGVPGLSNALKISKILGLNSEIIERAENYVYHHNDDLSKVLDKLINQSHEVERMQAQIQLKDNKLTENLTKLDFEKQKLFEDKKLILSKAEEEGRLLIKKAENKIKLLIDELEEMNSRAVKAHEIAEVKHELKVLKSESHFEDEVPGEERDFQIKESVFVESFGAYGIIISINKNNKYDVQLGNARVTVDKKQLRHSENHHKKNVVRPQISRAVSVKKNVSMTLDLRGERYEEAKNKLEKFIDDALYGALKQVQIIHGFGTGVIREMVLDYLKNNDSVETYRFGGANEGGKGITIVNLKNN